MVMFHTLAPAASLCMVPPASAALFPVMVELLTVSVLPVALFMPPPKVEEGPSYSELSILLEIVGLNSTRVPALYIHAPCVGDIVGNGGVLHLQGAFVVYATATSKGGAAGS